MSDNNFITHDMWKIIMLQVVGLAPSKIITGTIEGSRSKRTVLKYVFPEEAVALCDKWDRGDDDEIMGTVREVRNVMELFKENLRRRLD